MVVLCLCQKPLIFIMADSIRPIDQKCEEGLSARSFTVLSPVVTNGVVIDLYKKNKKLSWQTVVSAYKEEIENDLNESVNSGDSGSASDTGSVYHDGTQPAANESCDLNLYKKMERQYDDSLKLRGSKLENLCQR